MPCIPLFDILFDILLFVYYCLSGSKSFQYSKMEWPTNYQKFARKRERRWTTGKVSWINRSKLILLHSFSLSLKTYYVLLNATNFYLQFIDVYLTVKQRKFWQLWGEAWNKFIGSGHVIGHFHVIGHSKKRNFCNVYIFFFFCKWCFIIIIAIKLHSKYLFFFWMRSAIRIILKTLFKKIPNIAQDLGSA